MTLPEPATGLVIRYAFLWRDEALDGRWDGRKDRPCAIVVALHRAGAATNVMVAPITHNPPRDDASAIQIPPLVGARLGLDD